MIFVTTGTYEKPFDRLVEEVDRLKVEGYIDEGVFIQLGYSQYLPQKCEYKRFIEFKDMITMFKNARLVITHSAPASITLTLIHGKVPIVVPRKKEYGEYMNSRQVLFAKRLEEKRRIIAVYDVKNLYDRIVNYDLLAHKLRSNMRKSDVSSTISKYIKRLDEICRKLQR